MAWTIPIAGGVLALLTVLSISGCTRSHVQPPTAAQFASGPCRRAAPAVLSVGKVVQAVARQHKLPADVEQELLRDQTQLRSLPNPVDNQLAGKLRQLIVSIGFFRIAVDSHTYQPARLSDVTAAQADLMRYCTKS